MKKIFVILLFFCQNIYGQSLDEIYRDLDESRKYTFAFLNNLLDVWEKYHTESEEKKVIIYKMFLSSYELENSKRIEKIVEAHLHNPLPYSILSNKGKHEICLEVPVKYMNKNTILHVKFRRANLNENFKWKIEDIHISENQNINLIGLDEIEFEKDFSNFIDKLKRKESITDYFIVPSSFLEFLNIYDHIGIYDKSYTVKLIYKITEIPYYDKDNSLMGYKFLIISKETANKKSRKHGWHIVDEGEMDEYYKLYEKESIFNFYINPLKRSKTE